MCILLKYVLEKKNMITLQYTLKVRAHDGLYQDLCDVDIRLQNVNDNPPVFEKFAHQTTIYEEELETKCLIQVSSYCCRM